MTVFSTITADHKNACTCQVYTQLHVDRNMLGFDWEHPGKLEHDKEHPGKWEHKEHPGKWDEHPGKLEHKEHPGKCLHILYMYTNATKVHVQYIINPLHMQAYTCT